MDLASMLSSLTDFFSNDSWSALSTVLAAFGITGTAIFSFLRRCTPAKDEAKIGQYFGDAKLLAPPNRRPAYSDRMAHVLAEMSDLAYYEFEGASGFIVDAAKQVQCLNVTNTVDVQEFLESFSSKLMGNRVINVSILTNLLKASGFDLLSTINVEDTQGFACKRNIPGDEYVVIAFRGTEKKVSDWLTDLNAVPTQIGKEKVHTGFLKAFSQKKGADGKTVSENIEDIINSPDVKDHAGAQLPLFITGHSLGGALALVATKSLAPNIRGACYTFGAPRIANYEYFEEVKTPIYRVVNSSDVVPRVPPGALMALWVNAAKLLSWATALIPVVSSLFDKLESVLDKLNGYRHFGDLRYLTDVATGKFENVKLLSNPPAIDRIMWLWKNLASSLFFSIKSHSMKIYRKKLRYIASDRA